jgi:hypothetical protein
MLGCGQYRYPQFNTIKQSRTKPLPVTMNFIIGTKAEGPAITCHLAQPATGTGISRQNQLKFSG